MLSAAAGTSAPGSTGRHSSTPPTLVDVLHFVAMHGQAPIVARYGLGLNRFTWGSPELWRPLIDVHFGETKRKDTLIFDLFKSTERTRLMIYLKRGRRDLVVRALSFGADPNHNITALFEGREIFISTPIKCAIESKTLSIVRLILEQGADPAQVTNNDCQFYVKTPLECAVSAGNLAVVQMLVDEYGIQLPGAFLPDQVVPYANIPICAPLVRAIRVNHFSMVRYFVEAKGVRVNFPHSDRFNWSEGQGSWIANDDNVGAVNVEADLQSYLDHALWMESPMRPEAISMKMVTFLLDAGSVINYTGGSEEIEYPLLNAVVKRCRDIVALMLARGANPNLTSTWNRSNAMIGAAMNNDAQMAIALLGANAVVTESIHCEEISSFQ